MSVEDYMTHAEVAKMIGVTSATIGRWVKIGILDHQRKLGRWVVEKKQAERLFKHQKQHPFDWMKSWDKNNVEEE